MNLKIDDKTKSFLKREARIAWKALSFNERNRLGTYRPLFREMCDAWRNGATINLPDDFEEAHRAMEAGDEVDDNLGLHKLYGETPDMKPGQVAAPRGLVDGS